MKNKKFIREVLQLNPMLSCVDGFFYFNGYDHILSGFVCENASGGLYVWKYAYPLFDKLNYLHLNYGERLKHPDGFIDYSKISKADAASEFTKRIAKYTEEVLELRDLENFILYVERSPHILGNPNIRKCYAFSLILSDRYAEAEKQLSKVLESETSKTNKQMYDECAKLIKLIGDNNEMAKNLILSWEEEMKERLGLAVT